MNRGEVEIIQVDPFVLRVHIPSPTDPLPLPPPAPPAMPFALKGYYAAAKTEKPNVKIVTKPPIKATENKQNGSRPDDKQPGGQPTVQRRAVNKRIGDFPEKTDLSTPESAQAAWNRASAKKDAQAITQLSWLTLDPNEQKKWYAEEQRRNPKDLAIYLEAVAESTIIEVQTYRGRNWRMSLHFCRSRRAKDATPTALVASARSTASGRTSARTGCRAWKRPGRISTARRIDCGKTM